MEFSNIDELRNWFTSKNINITKWGIENYKSIQNLWDEIIRGESNIQDDPPLRTVTGVVQILIKKDNRILIEKEQELHNGTIRQRNQLPSEKMLPNENIKSAALRCLKEELGIKENEAVLIDKKYRKFEKIEISKSYPGLKSKYSFYIVTTEINNLPDNDFWTDEIESTIKETVKRHHWIWKDESDFKVEE